MSFITKPQRHLINSHFNKASSLSDFHDQHEGKDLHVTAHHANKKIIFHNQGGELHATVEHHRDSYHSGHPITISSHPASTDAHMDHIKAHKPAAVKFALGESIVNPYLDEIKKLLS